MYGYDVGEFGIWLSGLILLYSPAFGLFCFIIYKTFRKIIKCCWSRVCNHTTNNIVNEDDEDEQVPLLQQEEEDDDHLFADRLLNPVDYEEDDGVAPVP